MEQDFEPASQRLQNKLLPPVTTLTFSWSTKQEIYRHGLMSSVWKNINASKGALTSTPTSTTGMKWSEGCEPVLLVQNQSLTSKILQRRNEHNFPQKHYEVQWKVTLITRIKAVVAAKGEPTAYGIAMCVQMSFFIWCIF